MALYIKQRSTIFKSNFLCKNNKKQSVFQAGFTLIELITATAILGILISIVGGGLVSVMGLSRSKESQLNRKHELNRAADFIADDILAGTKVSTTVTTPGPNTGLFEITYQDGSPPVAYYLTPKGNSRWQGPYVLRRKESGKPTVALVDGIASRSPICLASPGTMKRQAGIQVTVQAEAHLKICLAGRIIDDEILTLSRQASTRN